MKNLPWPTAAVVVAAIAAVTVLGLNHVESSTITWVLLAVLGGLGVGELKAIKEQTNGTQSRLVEQQNKQLDTLTEQMARHHDLLADLARIAAAAGSTPPSDEVTP